MVLEATFICVDNSEWMRNGDYMPTRWDAQTDTLNMLCGSKIQSNPENSVGVLSMAGRRSEVVLALTTDLGKIMAELQSIRIQGKCDFMASIKIAQLGLKHRANKHQRQRIVMFVGSPVVDEEKTLVGLGKKLKKNNVALDIISFGASTNNDKLTKMVEAVNHDDNSHFIFIEGGSVMSDTVLSSAVIQDGLGDGSGNGGAAAAGGSMSHEFGIDPNADPELAMALRISMEEERARQERERKKEADEKGEGEGAAASDQKDAAADSSAAAGGEEKMEVTKDAGAASGEPDYDTMNEEELLQHALALSMQQEAEAGEGAASTEAKKDEEPKKEEAKGGEAGQDTQFEDANFVKGLLEDLPGVNMDDPEIQNALKSLEGGEKKEGEEGDAAKDENKKEEEK